MLHLTQVARHDHCSTENEESPNTIVVVCDGTNQRRQPLPPSRNAGLSSIRVSLGSNTRAMLDMAAGGSFRETTKLEKDRGKYLKEMRAPKEVKRAGRRVSISNPSYYLRPMAHTASSKICLVSLPKTPPQSPVKQSSDENSEKNVADGKEAEKNNKGRLVGPNFYVALAAAQFKLNYTARLKRMADMELRLLKRKDQRECVAKLKCVYALLCCLHNIKMKELKSREPMSFATVKALSQKPLHSLMKDHHHDTHHHSSPIHHAHHSRHTLTNHSTHHLHHNHGKNRNSRGRDFSLVETWEDLIRVNKSGEKVKGQLPPVTMNGTTGRSSTVLPKICSKETARLEQGNTAGNTETNHKSHKVLPPWQRQVVFVTNKDESLKRDPAKKLCDCIDSFHYFKSEMSQKVKHSLSERKQQLEKHMAVKLTNLELGANTSQCLENMREKAYQVWREERAEEDNKPLWYVLLEKEVSSVFEQRGGEGRAMLDKLKQFSVVDNDTIPHVLEKLCLVVMSLPANYLSIGPVFAAVEFVTEHIVKAPPTICQQWRDMRQLPSVTTELPEPAYLFGMRV